MNVLDFLSQSKVFESKGDARRAIKGKSISIDFTKVTDEKMDIPVVLNEDMEFNIIDAGTWMCNISKINDTWTENFLTEDLLLFKLIRKFGFQNMKGKSHVVDMILNDIFVVENGKRNFFIVKLKENG